MTESLERWYPRVQKWGFRPACCISACAGLAVLVGIAYALCVAEGWPTSRSAHLALAHLGIIRETAVYHPVWGWLVRLFGLKAAWLSVLSASVSVGLLAFCVSRFKDVVTGMTAGILLALSPWMVSAGTNVSTAAFDLVILLSDASFALEVRRSGRWLRWPVAAALFILLAIDLIRATIAIPLEHLLDGLVPTVLVATVVALALAFSIDASAMRRWQAIAWLVVVVLLMSFMLMFDLFSGVSENGRLAYKVSGIVLDRCPERAKWIVTDGALEDAFLFRIERDRLKVHLVCPEHGKDESYTAKLASIVSDEYPNAIGLRMAAMLGAVPLLEELPFVETNANAVVSVWSPDVWNAAAKSSVGEMISSHGRERNDPLKAYVLLRLAGMEGKNRAVLRRSVGHLTDLRLGKWTGVRDDDTNQVARVNEAVDKIIQDARAGDMTKIHADALELVREDRTNPLGNAILGTFLALEGDDEAAVVYLGRAVRRGNVPAFVWNDYAESLRRVNRCVEAEEALQHALKMAPNEWRFYETLADIRYTGGASDEKIVEALARAESLSADVPFEQKQTIVFLKAAMLSRSGKHRQTQAILRRLEPIAKSPYLKARISSIVYKPWSR